MTETIFIAIISSVTDLLLTSTAIEPNDATASTVCQLGVE